MPSLVFRHDSGAQEPCYTPYGVFIPGVPVRCAPNVLAALRGVPGFTVVPDSAASAAIPPAGDATPAVNGSATLAAAQAPTMSTQDREIAAIREVEAGLAALVAEASGGLATAPEATPTDSHT